MNKLFTKFVIFCILFFIPLLTSARESWPYLSSSELPDVIQLVPPAPTPEDPMFACDKQQYEWGKTQRETPRGAQAVTDARGNMHAVMKNFSDAMGITLTERGTPNIYTLTRRAVDTVMISIDQAKKHYQRIRPYDYFSEPSLIPEQEKSHSKNGAYPSGHAAIAWTTALILSEINPGAQDAILKRGYEFGQSRVIAGYHYQTDVDAGRLIATVIVNRLHAEPMFLEALDIAKKEFARSSASAAENAGNSPHTADHAPDFIQTIPPPNDQFFDAPPTPLVGSTKKKFDPPLLNNNAPQKKSHSSQSGVKKNKKGKVDPTPLMLPDLRQKKPQKENQNQGKIVM